MYGFLCNVIFYIILQIKGPRYFSSRMTNRYTNMRTAVAEDYNRIELIKFSRVLYANII